ncbi:hypothetical protein CRG98_042962, partial [Punica granatum]
DCKGALGRRAGPGVRRSGPHACVGLNARELGRERERWAERAGTRPNLQRVVGEDEVRAEERSLTTANGGSRLWAPRRWHVRRRRAPPGLRRARGKRHEARVGWDRGDFRDFGEVFEFYGEEFSSLIAGNPGGSRGGNEGVLFGVRSRVCFRGEIGAGSRDLRV